MLKKIVFLFVSAVFISFAFDAFASTSRNGFLFEIVNVVNHDAGAEYIAVEFRFFNQTGMAIVDGKNVFQYSLTDNFNNRYRPIQKPDNYTKELEDLPPNYPTLYPGESCTKTIFFETPVAEITSLELLIAAPALNIISPVSIPFSINSYDFADNSEPIGSWISIQSPENGAVLQRGAIFPLNIRLNPDQLPNELIISLFGQTFEDNAPSENNTYNIAIPRNTPVGLNSINVIGRWGGVIPYKDNSIASKNIVVFIEGKPLPTNF
ncbi:MAG: hypothetical protein V2A70_00205 [Candidatus Omnitrophota bacterium]